MRRVSECAGKQARKPQPLLASLRCWARQALRACTILYQLTTGHVSQGGGGGTSFPVSQHNLTHLVAAVHLSIYLGEKILIDNATFFFFFSSFAMLGIEPRPLSNLGKYSYH